MTSQLFWKTAIIGIFGYACIVMAEQVFGRYAVESQMHYFTTEFRQWLHSGLPEFWHSIWQY